MRFLSAIPVAIAVAVLTGSLYTACGDGVRYTQISAGANHTCGLRSDGGVVCWGSDEFGQLRALADERFTAVAAAGVHTCGLRPDGTAVCWGYTTPWGEDLAEVQGPLYKAPFPSEDERFTAIEAGGGITCGFRTEGDVVCWNIQGEFSPFGTEEVVQIDPAGTHVCGLRSDGRALCYNYLLRPPPEGERFTAISTAPAHSCGLRSDGSVLCWGIDIAGQLSPPEDGPFSSIAAGIFHTCGLRTDGSAVCWGNDLEQAVRIDGTGMGVNAPGMEFLFNTRRSDPPEGERFTAITAGALHTCGLRQDGGVSCWGYNNHGQASPPGDAESRTP